MATICTTQDHIALTQNLIQLYMLLEQNLDRCLKEVEHPTHSEHELQSNLLSSRAQLMDLLAANPVVKERLEEECKRVLSVTSTCLANDTQNSVAMKQARAEREALQCKIAALTELLGLFRSR